MSNSEVNTIGEKVGGGVPNGVRSSSSVTGSTDTESIDSATVIISGITKQEEMPAINPSNLSRTKPPTTIMPEKNSSRVVPLHSPTPIVGTPFDANKFEYPFPPLGDSSASNDPRPLSSSPRPPSACSQHILPGSPQSHTVKYESPPFRLRKYSPTPAKFLSNVREPPVPPGLVTKRHRISDDATRARSLSMDSAHTESDASWNISPMSWGSVLSSSADSSLECSDPSQRLVSEQRERKSGRGAIGDGTIDLEKRVRINEAEAVDASHRREVEEAGESTPV